MFGRQQAKKAIMNRQYQNGMTAAGWLIIMAIVLFFMYLAIKPRLGAKSKEIKTINEMISTITGPVGKLLLVALKNEPRIPLNAPNIAAIHNIRDKELVHCLAAAAGANNSELIKTTPTVCKPITIITTIKNVISILMRTIGMPKVEAYSESKRYNLISFQKAKTTKSDGIKNPSINSTSSRNRVAAWPNKYLSNPA